MAEILGLALGPAIVILIRLVVPLAIFRWPLWGGIAAGIADALDVVLLTFIGQGDFVHYTTTDKALDWYFLLFMAIISLKWLPLEKWTSLSLFGWRTIGVVLLEFFAAPRQILFIFPNLFLPFWYAVAVRDRFFPKRKLTRKHVIILLLLLLGPKLLQEYALHVAQLQPWEWIQRTFLGL